MNIKGWDNLVYFQSGEWQVVEEKLEDEDNRYNPSRGNLFAALDAVSYDNVRVVLMGQDPYPNPLHATGIAFSVPTEVSPLPPTLVNIFKEYTDDLGYPTPKNGDLTPWVNEGVLLWNVYPSCRAGKPNSHHWDEWTYLTKEIVEKLDARENKLVFCFLGRSAGTYSRYVRNNRVLSLSHPSPLGVNKGFKGSHIFSTINVLLKADELAPIDWRLHSGCTYTNKESPAVKTGL